jgi:hypothetical protein
MKKRHTLWIIALTLVATCSGCAENNEQGSSQAAVPVASVAQDVTNLWGVASVEIVDETTIRVCDIPSGASAQGRGMSMRDADRQFADELIVSVGGTFHVGDWRHVWYDYTLVRIESGKVLLRCTEVKDMRSFGDARTETISTLRLGPYETPDETTGNH